MNMVHISFLFKKYLFKNNFYLFIYIYLFVAALGLRCCAWAFSSCDGGATLRCGAQASHCGGFSCCGAWV